MYAVGQRTFETTQETVDHFYFVILLLFVVVEIFDLNILKGFFL